MYNCLLHLASGKLNSTSSVTTKDCKHLVIDAGHISIESDLADKAAVREVHMKRNQRYSDDDYKRLESLMYDKLSLKLQAAQVMHNTSFAPNQLLTCCIVRDWK